MSDKTGESVIVYPSEVRLYAYCPRILFFREHLGARWSLWLALRAILGKIYHKILEIVAYIRGFRVEDRLEERVGGVLLRGRPDYYRIHGDSAEIVEIKSGRGPRGGVWLSDLLQAATYGLILARRGAKRVELVVRYSDGARRLELSPDLSALALKTIDEVVLVKRHGLVPVALRARIKCEKCLYREECFTLDSQLAAPDGGIEEVGEWLRETRRLYAVSETT